MMRGLFISLIAGRICIFRWRKRIPSRGGKRLYQLPQVAEAAIIGVPDDRWGETGLAVVVVKPNEELSADDVIGHCLKQLAKFKVPASVEFIDELQRNGTGKVLKRTLRDQYVDASQPAIT